MLPFLTLKKLFKVEIFRLNLKDSSSITKIFLQNTKNQPKYVEKIYFYALLFVLSGDLVTRTGERELWSASSRVGIDAIIKLKPN